MTETKDLAVAKPDHTNVFVATPIGQIKKLVNAVDKAKQEIMIEDRDFMTLPGTKKPTLLKPGAEKLLKLFNLGARFEIIEEVQDHDREYQYQKEGKVLEWGTAKSGKSYPLRKEMITTDVKGWYFYKVKCTLFDQTSGDLRGDGFGTCSSNERPGQPANTIIKMAQKSSMMQATLTTCNASDLFTQDLEDLPRKNDYDNEPEPRNEVRNSQVKDSAPARSQQPADATQVSNGPACPKPVYDMIYRLLQKKALTAEDLESYDRKIKAGLSLKEGNEMINELYKAQDKLEVRH